MFESVRLSRNESLVKQSSRLSCSVDSEFGSLPRMETASGLRSVAAEQMRCPCCSATHCSPFLAAPDRFHGRQHMYPLVRCNSCSLVWLLSPPPPAEMGQHYGPDYDRAISGAGQDSRFWAGRRDTILSYKQGGSLLDLGCNAGGFLSSMAGPSWKLFGIEMSEDAARQAKASCGAEVFVGDILDASFPAASFDAITCFHVFEHLYQPKEVLAKVYEWLKPGGIFYTMMPNIDSAAGRVFGSYWYALELPRHLYHFSPATLRTLAQTSGLREVSITTHRHLFVETSVRYVVDDLCRKLGIPRTPMAQSKPPGILWRVVRKAFRLTILPVLERLAPLVGDGESIFAILTKD